MYVSYKDRFPVDGFLYSGVSCPSANDILFCGWCVGGIRRDHRAPSGSAPDSLPSRFGSSTTPRKVDGSMSVTVRLCFSASLATHVKGGWLQHATYVCYHFNSNISQVFEATVFNCINAEFCKYMLMSQYFER